VIGSSPAEGGENIWGPVRVAWGLAALLGITLVEVGVVAAFDPELESVGARLLVQAMLAATLIAVALAVAHPGSGIAPPAALGLRRPGRSPWAPAAIAYAAYLGFALVWSILVQPEQEDITRELGLDRGALATIAAGILIVAAAPLSEEVFFRGFMFGGLRLRLPFWAAGALSGAIFGLFHYTGPDSLGVVPQLAILGFVLCWLYERTGSLWPAIGVHALNNALAFAFLAS
jgi:uncharacterized protein